MYNRDIYDIHDIYTVRFHCNERDNCKKPVEALELKELALPSGNTIVYIYIKD